MSNQSAESAALVAQIKAMEAKNAALQAQLDAQKKAGPALRLKVSEKGAVSLYGMGRFPVTLYAEQWLKVVGMSDSIKGFIDTNKSQLHSKGQVAAPVGAGEAGSEVAAAF